MFRPFLLLCLFISPFIHADESVEVSATITQPDANTYCVSGVCLSVNSGTTSSDHGTTIGYGPTQAPGEPGTVVVQKEPECDVCQAGVFVFYMQPICCPDGSVCDIAGLLSSGSLDIPTDCGADGPAAITFDACTCTFYCNSTLGHGGAPTMPPTLPPTYPPTTIAPTEAPTTYAPTTYAPTEAPTTFAPTTYAPTTQAPTTQAPTTQAPTTQAPTTQAPTTKAPTTKAPTTNAPTTKAPTVAPTTKAPTTLPPTTAPTIPNRGNSPTQSPTCSRCNGTHVFFVVFPLCCTNQVVSLCNNVQIANAAKALPDNCDQNSITWDGCSCQFYCNTTSANVPVNPTHPGNAPVLPVPQNEIQTEQIDIKFNITKPSNNTRCIAGTSICITISSAPHTVVAFPVIASLILGLVSLL